MQKNPQQLALKMSINQSFAPQQDNSAINSSQLTVQPLSAQSKVKSSSLKVVQRKQMLKLIQLKEQLLAIRQRKAIVPKVPDPNVVQDFKILKEIKAKKFAKQKLKQKIQQKKKQLSKVKLLYAKSQLQFEEKNEIFKQKTALLRVLSTKMESELSKTKQRYREVQFNRIIVQGIRKLLYYRVCQIFFNDNIRSLFQFSNITNPNEHKDQDSIGNCLGYLTLFITLVGNIGGARMWINFTFRGAKSTIKLLDGTILALHPKQSRLGQALKILYEQLYQIMRDYLHIKGTNSQNFYQLCEQLSKELLSLK